jgi:lysophospholipase L1-like esterase
MFLHLGVLIVALMTAAPVLAQAPAGAPDKSIKMVVLGDSLSAGYGLPAPAAFPARLQKALADKGIKVDMINAGVSGDTSSGGRDRLDWSIPEGTEAVILELGANDALRLCRALQRDLSRAFEIVRRSALSILPGRRGGRRQTQPGRRNASDRRRR